MGSSAVFWTWTVVLTCYNCGGKFTERHLTTEKVRALPLMTPCPNCGARPVVSRSDSKSPTIVHRLFDVRPS